MRLVTEGNGGVEKTKKSSHRIVIILYREEEQQKEKFVMEKMLQKNKKL